MTDIATECKHEQEARRQTIVEMLFENRTGKTEKRSALSIYERLTTAQE